MNYSTNTVREGSYPRQKKTSSSFSNWMVNEGKARITFSIYLIAQVAYYAYSYYTLFTSTNLVTFRSVLGHGLPIARGAANLINFNCALILFTVSRNTISILRSTFLNRVIPFDKNITFHISIAWAIVFWSCVHVIAHYFNYMNVENTFSMTAIQLSLTSGPGWTGQVICVCLFLMVTSAVEAVRRKYFEMFWFTHHLFIIFFGMCLVHGAFCFIKGDDPSDPCRGGPTFWYWWIASGICYFLERLYREIRGRRQTKISKVIQHPCKSVEIQFKKPSFKAKAGQYIFICCPEISPWEWHPFTLTSSPYEDFVSLNIKVVGDWTTKLAHRLGCRFDGDNSPPPKDLPFVMLDGGYGSASEDVFDYEAALLVGAGIGVTPFASILKTIWYRFQNSRSGMALKKVYFVWSVRDKEAFSWFQDLLLTLEEENIDDFLEIHTYLTAKLDTGTLKNIYINDGVNGQDALTGLRAGTHYGRPNWDQIFSQIGRSHVGADIGVFFCGPKVLSSVLHKMSNKWSDVDKGTRFFYGKENF